MLLEELAAWDPDPVVRGRDVDDVRRMHVEVDAVLLGGTTQPIGSSGVLELGAFVALGVAEEELRERRPACDGLPHRVGLRDMGADVEVCGVLCHRATLGSVTDSQVTVPAAVHSAAVKSFRRLCMTISRGAAALLGLSVESA